MRELALLVPVLVAIAASIMVLYAVSECHVVLDNALCAAITVGGLTGVAIAGMFMVVGVVSVLGRRRTG